MQSIRGYLNSLIESLKLRVSWADWLPRGGDPVKSNTQPRASEERVVPPRVVLGNARQFGCDEVDIAAGNYASETGADKEYVIKNAIFEYHLDTKALKVHSLS